MDQPEPGLLKVVTLEKRPKNEERVEVQGL